MIEMFEFLQWCLGYPSENVVENNAFLGAPVTATLAAARTFSLRLGVKNWTLGFATIPDQQHM